MAFGSYEDTKQKKCDVVYMHSNDVETNAINTLFCYVRSQNTLVNNLLASEDELLTGIEKNCRYEIRRAEREGCICTVYTPDQLLNKNAIVHDFQRVYNEMFGAKRMSGYSFNKAMISKGIESRNVIISSCNPEDDETVKVYHAYLCDGNSTVLLYSASPLWNDSGKQKEQLIGRMNRYLHWCDMKWFKENGYKVYEWGGIWSVDNPKGIDIFKMKFGGEPRRYYNYTVARSLLGFIYTFLVRKKERKRKNAEDNN